MGPEGVRPSRNHRDVISDLKPARTNAAENIFSASLSPCQSSCVLPWHDDISMSAAARIGATSEGSMRLIAMSVFGSVDLKKMDS